MALQTTGAISLSNIATEFGGTAPHSLSEYYGAAAGVPASGAVSIGGFRGKSSQFEFAITANVTNANLRTLAVNAGWDGTSKVVATINSGVVVSGNTQGNSTAAMTINGSFPAGVTLINNGVIVGRGGNGGNGGINAGGAGATGGRALTASSMVSIQNNGTITGGGGGGGGGGGARTSYYSTVATAYGGDGGGGRSSNVNSSTGSSAGNNGGAGTYSAAGNGGSGIKVTIKAFSRTSGGGGKGGGWGAAGSGGGNSTYNGGAGGARGQAVNGNANITWLATGTRLGAIV